MDFHITLSGVVTVLSAIITIATAAGVIYKYLKKGVLNLVRDEMKEAITEAVRSGTEGIVKDVKSIKKKLDEHTKSSDGDICLIKKTLQDSIRDTITKTHKVCMAAGYIGEHEMYVVEQLFNDYESLDGNTFVPNLMDDLRELYKKCHMGKGVDLSKWSE